MYAWGCLGSCGIGGRKGVFKLALNELDGSVGIVICNTLFNVMQYVQAARKQELQGVKECGRCVQGLFQMWCFKIQMNVADFVDAA